MPKKARIFNREFKLAAVRCRKATSRSSGYARCITAIAGSPARS
jgi:hypothetical protein